MTDSPAVCTACRAWSIAFCVGPRTASSRFACAASTDACALATAAAAVDCCSAVPPRCNVVSLSCAAVRAACADTTAASADAMSVLVGPSFTEASFACAEVSACCADVTAAFAELSEFEALMYELLLATTCAARVARSPLKAASSRAASPAEIGADGVVQNEGSVAGGDSGSGGAQYVCSLPLSAASAEVTEFCAFDALFCVAVSAACAAATPAC